MKDDADEYPDGGWWFDGNTGWHIHPECEPRNAREVQEALAVIDAAQANSPTCRLCGQRVIALDAYGLCSKKSHEVVRSDEPMLSFGQG
ncbi:hypothetical protein [Leifsonia sp. Root227]|uniref:hypothetical protein n=1 Tax=Leifsonia sp. Root227 TaxID=1736496 RepID=UPI000AA756CD|nr:hypothetical protein [Leifsonia sp. Root227]